MPHPQPSVTLPAVAFSDLSLNEQLDAWLGPENHHPLATPTVGDMLACRATVAGRSILVLAFDYARQRGSIGPAEARQIGEVLAKAQSERLPLVFLMHTSGMRVTAGMDTVAALRRLLRATLDAKLAGQSLFAVITRYAFGGASMLASLCDGRTLQAGSQLAMSGPKLMERIAGRERLDAADANAVRALIGGEARAAVSESTLLCDDSPAAYRAAVAAWLATLDARAYELDGLDQRHEALRRRLGTRALPAAEAIDQSDLDATTRAALEELETPVQDLQRAGSVLFGRAAGDPDAWLAGLIGGHPATASAAFALADGLRTWAGPRSGLRITLLADVENHSADPDDEGVVLSEYLAHLALVMRSVHSHGNDVHVIVTGVTGGGIFAALAAGASRVGMLQDARIQVLPPAAFEALDKQPDLAGESLAAALAAGAVDSIYPHPTAPRVPSTRDYETGLPP